MKVLRKFRRDERGVAAVEFALLAPVLVLFYFGLVELSQAIIADRKTNHVASSVGDLVSQTETVSTTDLTDIFSISNTVMAPFPTSTLGMRVTSVTANAQGVPKVIWSRAYGGMGPLSSTVGTIAMPMAMAAGDSMIVAESQYTYNSVLHFVLPNALHYDEIFYLRPRRSDQVTCTDCPAT